MMIDSYALSIAGRRTNNEDAICAEPRLGLFVVADGMGGYEGGEIASALAVDAIHELVRRTAGDADVTWPYKIDPRRTVSENELMVATRLAADRIAAQRQGELADMGSTVVALRLTGNRAVIAHVGDSRVYRLRDGMLVQLTIDHSLAAQLEASGMTPDPNFAWRHVITRALGATTSEPDVQCQVIEQGDVFLLCSDGLSEVLAPAQIAALLAATGGSGVPGAGRCGLRGRLARQHLGGGGARLLRGSGHASLSLAAISLSAGKRSARHHRDRAASAFRPRSGCRPARRAARARQRTFAPSRQAHVGDGESLRRAPVPRDRAWGSYRWCSSSYAWPARATTSRR